MKSINKFFIFFLFFGFHLSSFSQAITSNDQILSITKGSGSTWQTIAIHSGNYCSDCYAFNFGHLPRPLPEPGRSYIFYPKLNHDLAVKEIYTMATRGM